MILDNEQQKRFLLELFKQVNFPGDVLEVAYTIKRAIVEASVTETVRAKQATYDAKADAR